MEKPRCDGPLCPGSGSPVPLFLRLGPESELKEFHLHDFIQPVSEHSEELYKSSPSSRWCFCLFM